MTSQTNGVSPTTPAIASAAAVDSRAPRPSFKTNFFGDNLRPVRKEELPQEMEMELENVQQKIEEMNQGQIEAAVKVYSDIDLAYKCILSELKNHPSQIIEDSASTLYEIPKLCIAELVEDAKRAQTDILFKAAEIMEDFKRRMADRKTELKILKGRQPAAQVEPRGESEEKSDEEPNEKSVQEQPEAPKDGVKAVFVKKMAAKALAALDNGTGDGQESNIIALEQNTQAPEEQHTPAPEEQPSGETSNSTKSAKRSLSIGSVASWDPLRLGFTKSRKGKTAAHETDPRKQGSQLASGVQGTLEHEDKLLNDLIKNQVVRPDDKEIPEGTREALRVLGWKVNDLTAENAHLRSQICGPPFIERNDGQANLGEKIARWSQNLLSAKSIIEKLPPSGRASSTSSGQPVLSLVEELGNVNFGTSVGTNTARSWRTPPQTAKMSIHTPKHVPSLPPVYEKSSRHDSIPKTTAQLCKTTTSNPSSNGHTGFPRFAYHEVPNEGTLSWWIIFCYIRNVLLGLFEPFWHVLFWGVAIAREISHLIGFLSFHLILARDTTTPPRWPGIPLMPARSLVMFALYFAIYMTINMFTAVCRERAIWYGANSLTRVYMLKTMREPQSWMGMPFDGNLVVSSGDVFSYLCLGEISGFLGWFVNGAWTLTKELVEFLAHTGVQALDGWRYGGQNLTSSG